MLEELRTLSSRSRLHLSRFAMDTIGNWTVGRMSRVGALESNICIKRDFPSFILRSPSVLSHLPAPLLVQEGSWSYKNLSPFEDEKCWRVGKRVNPRFDVGDIMLPAMIPRTIPYDCSRIESMTSSDTSGFYRIQRQFEFVGWWRRVIIIIWIRT